MAALASVLAIATLSLAWFGYVATREWNRSTELLLERRQSEALVLVSAALTRDMQGAFLSLLAPVNEQRLDEEPPFELQQDTARAFARFPYPDAFVVWRRAREVSSPHSYAFIRTERPPQWLRTTVSSGPFPITVVNHPPVLEALTAALRDSARPDSPLAVARLHIEGRRYQVVARLMFERSPSYELSGFAAILVEEQWVRDHYFQPLLLELAHIGGNADALSFTIADEHGSTVAGTGTPLAGGSDVARPFPLSFVEPSLIRPRQQPVTWMVHVWPSDDSTLIAARLGSRRTFVLLVVTAIANCIALVLVARAVQVRMSLASMKSDFVSAVTHELKTPLSLIGLVGDTLRDGRYASPDTIRRYAAVLSQESRRLSHSIDNLLTYARYADGRSLTASDFRPAHIGELVEDALERFRPTLEERQFQLDFNVPESLPVVMADPPSLLHVFENIIDNAIKYSGTSRQLAIGISVGDRLLHVVFRDRGIGIPEHDLGHVFGRFFRAHNTVGRGSGLGLTIASRIVNAHGGRIDLESIVGEGTSLDVVLPLGEPG